MTALVVHPSRGPLRGLVASPVGATTLQLALLCGSVAEAGAATRLAAKGAPPLPSMGTLEALGVAIEHVGDMLLVTGMGLRGLAGGTAPCPTDPIVLGTILGLLASSDEVTRLQGGDERLGRHAAAAARILRLRGAQVEGVLDPNRPGVLAPPLVVGPAPAPMAELQLELSPQDGPAAKAAAITSGLAALGDTFIHEPVVSDDRLERMLSSMGVDLETMGPMLRVAPAGRPLRPLDGPAPGDEGLALAILTAAVATEGQVGLRAVGLNPSRRGWLEGLRDAGAQLGVENEGDRWGQSVADVHLAGPVPRPLRLAGERGRRAGAPLPILAALAAFTPGESELADLSLPHPGQLPATLRLLQAFELPVRPIERGLSVGDGRPRATEIHAGDDAAVAMAATLLALAAEQPSRILGAEVIGLSFPRFVGYLRGLGATIDVEAAPPTTTP